MIQVFQNVGQPELREALHRAVPGQEEQMASIFAEEMMAKGHAKGFVEGKAEGENRAKADTLLRQLQRRFGPIPTDVQARVDAATTDQLDHWLDAILEAPDRESVFRPTQPS